MAVKGDLISEDIIMEGVEKAILNMNMLDLIREHTGKALDEILLVPQFMECGDGTQVVMHEADASLRKTQAMLVKIGVHVPHAEDLPYGVQKKIEDGFKKIMKGYYVINFKMNHESLYRTIKG
jgi:hypothetical protein